MISQKDLLDMICTESVEGTRTHYNDTARNAEYIQRESGAAYSGKHGRNGELDNLPPINHTLRLERDENGKLDWKEGKPETPTKDYLETPICGSGISPIDYKLSVMKKPE